MAGKRERESGGGGGPAVDLTCRVPGGGQRMAFRRVGILTRGRSEEGGEIVKMPPPPSVVVAKVAMMMDGEYDAAAGHVALRPRPEGQIPLLPEVS